MFEGHGTNGPAAQACESGAAVNQLMGKPLVPFWCPFKATNSVLVGNTIPYIVHKEVLCAITCTFLEHIQKNLVTVGLQYPFNKHLFVYYKAQYTELLYCMSNMTT